MHRFRRALTALFAGVIVTIATVGVTAPAQAEPSLQATATDTAVQSDSETDIESQATGYRLLNSATGRCLQAQSSTNAVLTSPCGTTTLQRWTVSYTTSGARIFKNVSTGKCLDSNSVSVYTHTCNTGSNQRWYRQYEGPYRYMNAATSKCLDSNSSGSVYPHTCNTGSNQRWYAQS
jgi:serine/threonine-protein kinase